MDGGQLNMTSGATNYDGVVFLDGFFETDASFFPPGVQLAGSWEWEFSLRDTIGNGWDVAVPFQVVPLGDFDGDGIMDAADIDSLAAHIVAGSPFDSWFDLTGDDTVDEADLTKWRSDAATHNGFSEAYQLGNSNLDGTVDATDLNNLALNWQQSVSEWSGGDFTADGFVDSADLNALALIGAIYLHGLPRECASS